MKPSASNIFSALPQNLENEVFQDLLKHDKVRIERILSKGQVSPPDEWYDQEENEWVMVLQGNAILQFEDGTEVKLAKGDYLNIPARLKHKVSWTDPEKTTVWLAVFYG